MADREMLDLVDYYGRPFQLDPALRVTVRGYGEGYLDGNMHMFRGRFGVWYPDRMDIDSGWTVCLDCDQVTVND